MIPTSLYRLQWGLCFTLFFLIVLGAGVRLADAGLACPDWPLCFGQVIPKFDTQIFLEWFHRKIAFWVGVVALIIAFWIWLKAELRKNFGWWMIASLLLFLVQAILGRETVTRLLHAHIVSAHLIGGYALYALHLFVLTRMRELREVPSNGQKLPEALKSFIWIFWVFSFIQTLLGGLVSSNYAGLACGSSFPQCLGEWFPNLQGAVAIHYFHRVGAFLVLGFAIISFFWAKKTVGKDKILSYFKAVLVLVLLQFIWGIGMLHSEVHFGLSLAHSATSLLIFTVLALGSYHVRHR